jgi:polyisoprenoid-binding protein YceI
MKFVAVSVLLFLSSLSSFHSTPLAIDNVQPVSADTIRFRLDPARSTFMVHANRAGLAWFKGKSHRIAVKEWSGEASMSLDSVSPASLEMDIKSASLGETRDVFTAEQKATINKELNEIVLETAKYPDITFKSTEIMGRLKNGSFDVRVTGDITLHGVTRKVTIPAIVTADGNTFHAKGQFKLNRKKFGVNATEAFHGFVKVRHTLIFVFDIIGEKV